MKVVNGILTLTKQEIATIVRDAANYLIDDEMPDEMKNVLSYPVEVINDGTDILGKKNVNFSLDCAADVTSENFETWKNQRIEQGFDELWNLDGTILQFIIPRLKEYRKLLHGYPGNYDTFEHWQHDLDEMIWAMEWYNSEDLKEEWKLDEKGNYITDDNKNLIPTEEHQRAKNGWKLFCDNFFGLWD